jgi:uncharacterized protein
MRCPHASRDRPVREALDSGFRHLPVELFETRRGCYAFDAKRVVFHAVDRTTFEMLTILRERDVDLAGLVASMPERSAREVRRAWSGLREAQQRGYLQPYTMVRKPPHDAETVERVLTTELGGFTVFVTQRCNLACSYCIYGGRYRRYDALSDETMSWETARNMLEFLLGNSRNAPSLRLDFFGGEPLLAFDLIARSVEYLEGRLDGGKELQTSVSTNGTILTDEIMAFLLRHGTYIQFSLDGEKESHDRKRPFRGGGRSSYEAALASLQRLHDRDAGYVRDRVRIKSVVSPDTIDVDSSAFYSHPVVKLVSDEGHLSMVVVETDYDVQRDGAFFAALDEMRRWLCARSGLQTLEELLAPLNPKQKAFYHHTFADFYEVQAINKVHFGASNEVWFRKGCLTGYRDGAVMPDGTIVVCHKATSFPIGNVNEGHWDFDRLHDLHRRLNQPWPACSSCFVQRFCDLCFEKMGGAADWDADRKRFCAFTRRRYLAVFGTMLEVLDRNPELWRDLDRLVRQSIDKRARQES